MLALVIPASVEKPHFTEPRSRSKRSQDGRWVALELLGLVIYGSMAFLGLRRSQWWLVAGWAFHPAWDMALHYFGPGHAFAPAPYALACMTWDPTVAAYIAFRILRPAKVMSAAVADKVDQRSWPVSDPRLWPIHARSLLDPEQSDRCPDTGR